MADAPAVDLSDLMTAPPSTSVDKKTFVSQMDKTFGKGKWNLTSGYRSRAKEDALRASGAGTVPAGETSEHSEGSEDAPGAYDVQVPGLTASQVAAKIKASDPDFHVMAEGRHGPEGPHVHIGVSPKVDLSDLMGESASANREMVTVADRKPVTQHELLQRVRGPSSPEALRQPLTGHGRPPGWFQQFGEDVANRVREGAADVEDAAKGNPILRGPAVVSSALNEMFEPADGAGEQAGRAANAVTRAITGSKGPETATEARVRGQVGDVAALGASLLGVEGEALPTDRFGRKFKPGELPPVEVREPTGAANEDAPLSRAQQKSARRFVVFDATKPSGAEGVFPTEAAAKKFIADNPHRKSLDYASESNLERWNPTGPESDAFNARRVKAADRPSAKPAPRTPEEAYQRDAQTLKDNGVYLTPGQAEGGEKARRESAEKSNPLWSKTRRADEDKSIMSFNRAVYNRVLAPIGVKVKDAVLPSREAVAGVEGHLSNAYERIKPGISATLDAPTTQSISEAVKGSMINGRAEQEKLEAFLDQKVYPHMKGGVLDGEGYIAVKSALSKRIRDMAGDPSLAVRDSAEQYQQVLDAIMDSAERYSAPGVREALKKADTGWAMLTRLQEASTRRLDGQGQFSPRDLLSAVRHQSPSVGGRRPAFSRGDALLQDIADPGVRVLPDRVPASDTAEKMQRNNRGVAGAVAGNVIGGPVGAVAGYVADRAAPKVTNLALQAMLDSRAKRGAAPGGASGARTPQNYLARIGRATSPLVNHRVAAPVNALAILNSQPQNQP